MALSATIIRPHMTVLDVVSRYRETEQVFKTYDHLAGECICCKALFEPLERVAEKYGLDLNRFLEDLEAGAVSKAQNDGPPDEPS
jgi:hypothetical protein